MPRAARVLPPDTPVHVLNRANRRAPLFLRDGDYRAFCEILSEGLAREAVPLYAWCLMPNHWHLVVHVRDSAQLARAMHWVTTKHVRAWHQHRDTTGEGHLYQGRYKAFAVEADAHFLVVCRYVERNPVRAGLVRAADEWRWSSNRSHIGAQGAMAAPRLAPWPVVRPKEWQEWVDLPQSDTELAAMRTCVRRGAPFGSLRWTDELLARARRRGVHFRPRGRPACPRAKGT